MEYKQYKAFVIFIIFRCLVTPIKSPLNKPKSTRKCNPAYRLNHLGTILQRSKKDAKVEALEETRTSNIKTKVKNGSIE